MTLLIGVAVVAVVLCREWRVDPEREFQAGWEALYRGDLTHGMPHVQRLREQHKGAAVTRLLTALLQLRSGSADLALWQASQITDRRHEDKRLLLMGECLYGLGRYQEAEAAFRDLHSLAPDSALAYQWLLAVYFDLGAYDAATRMATRLTELRPQDFAPHRLLGMMARDFEQNQQAITHFRRALSLVPPVAVRLEIVEELGAILIDEHEYQAAIELLVDEAVTTPWAHATLANAFWAVGKQQQGWNELTAAEQSGPPDERVLMTRARFEFESGHHNDAVATLERVLKIDKSNINAYYVLAQVLTRLGREAEARTSHETHEQLIGVKNRLTNLNLEALQHPHDRVLREQLADICEQLGKRDLAAMWRRAAEGLRFVESDSDNTHGRR